MKSLVDLLELRGGLKVLEIACGAGHLGKMMASQRAKIDLYVSDNSGQMLRSCENRWSNHNATVLYFDPVENSHNWEHFFPSKIRFDRIVSHLAFPFPEMDREDFGRVVDFLDRALAPNGRAVMSVHNTAMDISEDTYSTETDAFRRALVSKYKESCGHKAIRRLKAAKMQPNDLIGTFTAKGLSHVDTMKGEYAFTMHDRLKMWATPAVLNSLVDVERVDKKDIQKVTESLAGAFQEKDTAPLSCATLVFEKAN